MKSRQVFDIIVILKEKLKQFLPRIDISFTSRFNSKERCSFNDENIMLSGLNILTDNGRNPSQ